MRTSATWTRARRAAADASARRGLSLLEVLVALAIVVALAGIALPWVASRLEARLLPESASRLSAFLMLARAESMSSGRVVAVRLERGDSGTRLVAEHLDPAAIDLGRAGEGGSTEQDDLDAIALAVGEEDEASASTPIAAGWARLDLDPALGLRRISSAPRAEFDEPDAGTDSDPDVEQDPFEAIESEEEGEDLPSMLALFLPDGSNLLAASWWLEQETSPEDPPRRRRLDLDDPTGLPRWASPEPPPRPVATEVAR